MLIRNKLNSPQTIHTVSGPVLLPAGGEVEIEALEHTYDALYRRSQFIEIDTNAPQKRGRSRKDGSK